MSERIEAAFSGDFHFGYRDIPLRRGESLVNPSVVERGLAFTRGNDTALEPGTPGTFGVVRRGDSVRIVWYFTASDQTRAFTISYTLRGIAVAYDDVVDVNLKVWGDQWNEPLDRLVGVETAPGKILRAWGKPVWVRGDVELVGTRATLRAVAVPAHQFVELRTLIARSAFASTAGMKVARGPAFQRIVAEELADAKRFKRDHDRIDALEAHPLRTGLAVLGLAIIPALLVIALVFWFMGREHRTGYDREYEQEPPTDTEPALVPTLLRQGGDAGSYEFTATLFDLIRRGVYKAEHVTTERPIWGGLRNETVSDLELTAGESRELRSWERAVADVVDSVLDGGSERLSRFRERIQAERESMSRRFEAFKTDVAAEVDRLAWFRSTGAVPLGIAVVLFALAGGVSIFLAVHHWRPVYPRYSDVLLVGLGVCLVANAVLCLGTLLFNRRAWRRRSRSGQEEAERWGAFRRYLSDFPRLQEAPPATIELWERYLVYGIALRDRGARAPGRAAAHARGGARGELDLLDLVLGRPGLRRDQPVRRGSRLGIRRRARAAELGLGRLRRRLLGRWRWRRRRRRRRLRLNRTGPPKPSGAEQRVVARSRYELDRRGRSEALRFGLRHRARIGASPS